MSQKNERFPTWDGEGCHTASIQRRKNAPVVTLGTNWEEEVKL